MPVERKESVMYKRFTAVAVTVLALAALAAAQEKPACCQKKKASCDKAKAAQCQDKADKCKLQAKKDCCAKKDKQCCDKKKAKCGDVSCTGEQVGYKGVKFPRLAYMVGDQRTDCPKTAAKLAKEKNLPIKYVVGDKVFDEKPAALAAQTEVLEDLLGSILSIKYVVGDECVACPHAAEQMAKQSGAKVKYRLGSFVFDDQQAAEQAAAKAREAADAVEMKVDNGEVTRYKVGKLVTTSKVAATYQLAIERLKAALDALERAGGKQVAAPGGGCGDKGTKIKCATGAKGKCKTGAKKTCDKGAKGKCGSGAKKP